MSDQTNCILNEISKDEKFIKVYTLHSERFKKNIRRNEKFRQRSVDENKIQRYNKIIKSLFF